MNITDNKKQEIFDAVRFLAPDEIHKLFVELAEATKALADEYDTKLEDIILS